MNSEKIENTKKLEEVVKMLNSGVDFYSAAMKQVDNLQLATVFSEMAAIHEKCVNILQPFIVMVEGEPEEGSDFSIDVQKVYTRILSELSTDSDFTLIKQLESLEDKIIEKIDEVAAEDLPLICLEELLTARKGVKSCYDRMVRLLQMKERLAC